MSETQKTHFADDATVECIAKLERELSDCRKECEEQARLNGMGSQREARLMAELAEAQKVIRSCGQYIPEKEETDRHNRTVLNNLLSRITAALAEKDEGWVECSKKGALRNATFIDSKLLGCHIATERRGVWYARKPLPPLPTERKV